MTVFELSEQNINASNYLMSCLSLIKYRRYISILMFSHNYCNMTHTLLLTGVLQESNEYANNAREERDYCYVNILETDVLGHKPSRFAFVSASIYTSFSSFYFFCRPKNKKHLKCTTVFKLNGSEGRL